MEKNRVVPREYEDIRSGLRCSPRFVSISISLNETISVADFLRWSAVSFFFREDMPEESEAGGNYGAQQILNYTSVNFTSEKQAKPLLDSPECGERNEMN